LEDWARRGLSDKQIAQNIGISQQTFYDWSKRFPEFSEAIKKGKAPVDFQVENALLKRALGYEYTETRIRRQITGYQTIDGKRVPIYSDRTYEEATKKYVPGDVLAQIYWLKNRRPDIWRDKPETTDTTALDKLDAILNARIEESVNAETV